MNWLQENYTFCLSLLHAKWKVTGGRVAGKGCWWKSKSYECTVPFQSTAQIIVLCELLFGGITGVKSWRNYTLHPLVLILSSPTCWSRPRRAKVLIEGPAVQYGAKPVKCEILSKLWWFYRYLSQEIHKSSKMAFVQPVINVAHWQHSETNILELRLTRRLEPHLSYRKTLEIAIFTC